MDIVIAIDGPVASGKSTVASLVAADLGYRYIDTGAMYRAIALATKRKGIAGEDEAAIAKILPTLDINLTKDARVLLNQEDVTKEIRTPEISNLVSVVSVHKSVRDFLLEKQRSYAKEKGVVMEGRDIGSHVVPDAELKIFQVASAESRAQRRYLDFLQRGIECDKEQLIKDIKERDLRDSTREHAPLTQVADSVYLETSNISAREAADIIVALAKARING